MKVVKALIICIWTLWCKNFCHNTDFGLIGSGISLSKQLFFILDQLLFQYREVDFGHSRHVFPVLQLFFQWRVELDPFRLL
jgi:hypothetical protein